MLLNDTDLEGSSLSIIAVGNATPAGASVQIRGPFAVYTSPTASAGDGGFEYTVSDGTNTAIGTVTISTSSISGAGSGGRNEVRIVDHGSTVTVYFIGIPGTWYRFQTTPDVGSGPPAWSNFDGGPADQQAPSDGIVSLTETKHGGGRFYRAIKKP